IAPDMATMLVFIVTDANISQRALDKALTLAVGPTFNCITVDGCMSTNDSVEMLANAASNSPLIDTGKSFEDFKKALNWICLELAKSVVRDAEGATKFITIKVKNAKSECEAKHLAMRIANSNLFKTAIFGQNPNFGRIVSAVGASGVGVKERDIRIKASSLAKKDISVEVSVNRGRSSIIVYTSDLTYKYVKINAEYN
ncbi:MAG: bifunctional ornithine acetyltransferase/N-acetylglutamate synthase, partial [Candidatus Omnitrophota bacterium]